MENWQDVGYNILHFFIFLNIMERFLSMASQSMRGKEKWRT